MIDKRPSGSYRVRIYNHGRYVTSRTFRRKTDAVAWQRAQEAALAAGTWAATMREGATVAESWDQYQKVRRPVRPSTLARQRSLAMRHILPAFGRRPLSSIAPSEVAAWANRLCQDLSPSTARQALGLLRGIYRTAVVDGVITRSPAEGIRLPKVPRNEPKPLTHDQVRRLADAMVLTRDRLMVLVMSYGGLRWGECIALRRRCVQGHTLRLTEAAVEVGGVFHIGPLKDRDARTVVLPRSVAAELRTWASKQDDFLFTTHNKTLLRNGNWRRSVLNPAIEKSAVPYVTPHNLRDTAASLAIQAGASVVTVAAMLGHENPSTTLQHYAGLFPSDLDSVANRLETGMKKARERASQ